MQFVILYLKRHSGPSLEMQDPARNVARNVAQGTPRNVAAGECSRLVKLKGPPYKPRLQIARLLLDSVSCLKVLGSLLTLTHAVKLEGAHPVKLKAPTLSS